MTRRAFLSLVPKALPTPQRRPNILFILADDLGYGDLSCYGGRIPTPNIDRLASQGVRFTLAYAGGPVCSASRCTLLTGRYAQRQHDRSLSSVVFPETTTGLQAPTLADLLRYRGYNTGCFGKWHLGHARPEFLPLARGFNEFAGVPYSNDMTPLPWMSGNEPVSVVNDGAGTDIRGELTGKIVCSSLEFIRHAQAESQTFFAYVPFTTPHLPQMPGQKFVGATGLGPYADSVFELDFAVGELVSVSGPDTLVVVASDNGPDTEQDLPTNSLKPSTGELSGRKFGLSEGGIRVPLIVCAPGGRQGEVCNQIVSFADFWPTLGRIAGLFEEDSHLSSDGVDISPLFFQQGRAERPILIHFLYSQPQAAVKDFDWRRFKLFFSFGEGIVKPTALYELNQDPREQNNVLGSYPEVVRQMGGEVESVLSDI